MRATSRLDIVVVDPDPDWVSGLIRDHVLGPDGAPGTAATTLAPAGFRRWWVDRPDGLALWANRQGGFTVRCPTTDVPVIEAFAAAWGRMRGSQAPPGSLSCPSCGDEHPLAALVYRPHAAFGRSALVLAEVEAPEVLVPRDHQPRVVLRRG